MTHLLTLLRPQASLCFENSHQLILAGPVAVYVPGQLVSPFQSVGNAGDPQPALHLWNVHYTTLVIAGLFAKHQLIRKQLPLFLGQPVLGPLQILQNEATGD